MGFKKKIEDNVVLWLLGTLLAGFLAGIGTYKGILEIAQLKVVSVTEYEKLNPGGVTMPKSALVVGTEGELMVGDFLNQHSTFDVDLTAWQPVRLEDATDKKVSAATVTRRDLIRKVTSKPVDYAFDFWTSGVGIDAESILAYPQPEFVPVRTEQRPDGTSRKLYRLRLPLASFGSGTELPMFTRFIVWNGFQKSAGEDWRARIEYPTKAAAITIRFPIVKKVESVSVFLGNPDGNKIAGRAALSDSNPVLLQADSSGRQIALWAGLEVPGNHVLLFEWKWIDR